MALHFSKMQGAGNDFVLIDNRSGFLSEQSLSELAPSICNRKYGIGSDGVITLQDDPESNGGLLMVYKNPDGSDAGMCGNGARCFAAFARWLGYGSKINFRVHQSKYKAECRNENVTIDFPLETSVKNITLEGKEAFIIYTNTEHVVCPLQSFEHLGDENFLIKNGRKYRYHEMFQPKGTNVNFIYGRKKKELHLQTYERGVENLTFACGTGAIASAIGWHHLENKKTGNFKYTVKTKGGTLVIHFSFNESNGRYHDIKLEGPAVFVFEGEYYL